MRQFETLCMYYYTELKTKFKHKISIYKVIFSIYERLRQCRVDIVIWMACWEKKVTYPVDWVLLNFEISILIVRILLFFYCVFYALKIEIVQNFISIDITLSKLSVYPVDPVIIILATGFEVRGFDPGRGRWIFQSVKILSMTSFGREVKPWVPCRRFTACKRTSSRN